ncbi:MAG: hypothetical protein RIG62_09760 [Cyclobacteriaceae bacterium]
MTQKLSAVALAVMLVVGTSCEEDDSPAVVDVTVTHSSRGSFASDLAVGSGQEARTDYYSVTTYAFGSSISIYRPYFSFDLSGQSGTVTEAVLRIYNPADGYDSPDDSETIEFHEVTTSAADLLTADDNDAINADLGDGTLYGSIEATAEDDEDYLEITLNEDAIAAINNSVGSGTWSVGASLITGKTDESHTIEQVFNRSDPDQPDTELVLTIE